jgi:hypothetical protein
MWAIITLFLFKKDKHTSSKAFMELINKLHTRARFERLHSLRRHGDQLPHLYPILRSINPLLKRLEKTLFIELTHQ